MSYGFKIAVVLMSLKYNCGL